MVGLWTRKAQKRLDKKIGFLECCWVDGLVLDPNKRFFSLKRKDQIFSATAYKRNTIIKMTYTEITKQKQHSRTDFLTKNQIHHLSYNKLHLIKELYEGCYAKIINFVIFFLMQLIVLLYRELHLLVAMLMYCPNILYPYSRYIFGSFVSTHLQMNLRRKVKAKLLFKTSCFKRCIVYANNKVLVFPPLYDSLIHVRKKGFSLCHVTVFHSGLTRLFMWLIYDSKKDMCT